MNAPTIYLALALGGGGTVKRTAKALAPSVYLATAGRSFEVAALSAPSVYLAHVPGAQGDNVLLGQRGVPGLPKSSWPALLVSFVYLRQFIAQKNRYCCRSWVLDSGAFTARAKGIDLPLASYIEACKTLQADPMLDEVYALDVIGDPQASLANARAMRDAGVACVPTYHLQDRDWGVLSAMAEEFPKVALGGMVGVKGAAKTRFIEQSFARVWPKKVHGFGCHSERLLMRFPFHSADATNWEVGPCKFGAWRSFGRANLSWRGSAQDLRSEVEWYLALERKLQARWRQEMELLERGAE